MANDKMDLEVIDIPEVEVSRKMKKQLRHEEKLAQKEDYNKMVSKWQEQLVVKNSTNTRKKTEKQISESEALFHEAQKSYLQVDRKIDTFISNFVKNQDNAAKQKKRLKTVFFIITMVIFCLIVLMPIITLIVLMVFDIKDTSIYISAVAGGTVEILATVIILPKIVAEYLFNKEEENSNIKIVELMQKYSETMHGYEEHGHKENKEKENKDE